MSNINDVSRQKGKDKTMLFDRSLPRKRTRHAHAQPDEAVAADAPPASARPDAGFSFANVAINPALPVQKKGNDTGLPDNLKSGVESLSGLSLDAVKVHYNSAQPAQLQALAFAQGTDIHVGPGQEQHLPHEAWHIVQQMQGRVTPTAQASGAQVNDDAGLENEADVMGAKASQSADVAQRKRGTSADVLQRVIQMTGWTSAGNRATHFSKHQSDTNFAYSSEAAYGAAAVSFVDSPPATVQKKTSGGKTYCYDAATDQLAVVAGGKIVTFFQPGRGNSARGQTYFDKQ